MACCDKGGNCKNVSTQTGGCNKPNKGYCGCSNCGGETTIIERTTTVQGGICTNTFTTAGNTYIGGKYLTSFADPIQHSKDRSYPFLEIVIGPDQASYVSRQPVPAGVELTDECFWVKIYDFNAQIEQNRQLVQQALERLSEGIELVESLVPRIEAILAAFDGINADLADLKSRVQTNADDISGLQGRADALDAAVQTNANDIAALQNRADRLETRIQANTDNIESIQSQIATISARLATISTQIASILISISDLEKRHTVHYFPNKASLDGFIDPDGVEINVGDFCYCYGNTPFWLYVRSGGMARDGIDYAFTSGEQTRVLWVLPEGGNMYVDCWSLGNAADLAQSLRWLLTYNINVITNPHKAYVFNNSSTFYPDRLNLIGGGTLLVNNTTSLTPVFTLNSRGGDIDVAIAPMTAGSALDNVIGAKVEKGYTSNLQLKATGLGVGIAVDDDHADFKSDFVSCKDCKTVIRVDNKASDVDHAKIFNIRINNLYTSASPAACNIIKIDSVNNVSVDINSLRTEAHNNLYLLDINSSSHRRRTLNIGTWVNQAGEYNPAVFSPASQPTLVTCDKVIFPDNALQRLVCDKGAFWTGEYRMNTQGFGADWAAGGQSRHMIGNFGTIGKPDELTANPSWLDLPVLVQCDRPGLVSLTGAVDEQQVLACGFVVRYLYQLADGVTWKWVDTACIWDSASDEIVAVGRKFML